MSMMRIAIAGTNGLALEIARFIQEGTAHQVILLSRTAQSRLTAAGYQVFVVDYGNPQTISFALRGVDTVISTLTGLDQLQLIRAAIAVGVRRFALAEFEGLPQLRPHNDPLDRSRSQALSLIASRNIQYTTFICGILYERFQPGGLRASRIGATSGFSSEGDYMVDCRNMQAQVPAYDLNNNPTVTICMTAARDVGRFVAKAVDMSVWPTELRMCGHRALLTDLIAAIQQLKRQRFDDVKWHSPHSLRSDLQLANAQQDYAKALRIYTLIATSEGRYDFILSNPNNSLNHRFPEVKPITFQEWFTRAWGL